MVGLNFVSAANWLSSVLWHCSYIWPVKICLKWSIMCRVGPLVSTHSLTLVTLQLFWWFPNYHTYVRKFKCEQHDRSKQHRSASKKTFLYYKSFRNLWFVAILPLSGINLKAYSAVGNCLRVRFLFCRRVQPEPSPVGPAARQEGTGVVFLWCLGSGVI